MTPRQYIDHLFEISRAPRIAPAGQKWKIQTRGVRGWCDVKVGMLELDAEDERYETELFDTYEEAQEEVDSMFGNSMHGGHGEGGIDGDPSDFRIVTADTPADEDLY
jgi:hypothetical protein